MKVRISIIGYSNTIPFVYGLQSNPEIVKQSEFLYNYPAEGVERLNNNEADICIVPMGAIPSIKNAHIISNFCISALKEVDSVILCSYVPLHKITKITLDYQSRTSNLLTQVLAKNVWNIMPYYTIGTPGYEIIEDDSAKVLIGDRALLHSKQFPYVYDLSLEWYKAYQLPFVFACWIANKPISQEYLQLFEDSLAFGVHHIDDSIKFTKKTFEFDIHSYLHNRIQYKLNSDKKRSMELFYEKISQLKNKI